MNWEISSDWSRSFASQAIATISMRLLATLRASANPASEGLQHLPASDIRRIMLLLPLNDRLAVSQTCRKLRSDVTGMPELWSNVSIAPQLHLGRPGQRAVDSEAQWRAALEILSRCPSGTRTARLLCILEISFTSDVMTRMIQRCLGELPFVRFEVSERRMPPEWRTDLLDDFRETGYLNASHPRPDAWTAFIHALRSPAPQLDSLHIVAPSRLLVDRSRFSTLPSDLLAGTAAANKLRRCLLSGSMRLPPGGCPAFAGLTVFDYQSWPGDMTTGELEDILRQMPCLEILGLRIQSLRADPSDITPSLHPRLRSVALKLNSEGPAVLVVRCVQFFQRRSRAFVSVDLMSGGFVDAPVGNQWSNLPFPLSKPNTLLVKNGAGFASGPDHALVLPIRARDPYLTDPELYNTLVSLTLSEMYWDAGALPAAPRLQDLCIELFACSSFWRKVEEFSGVFVTRLHTPWACPALERFEFAFARGPSCARYGTYGRCVCTAGGVLLLEDVSQFIQRNLSFSSAQLRCVSLTGVRAVVDDDPGAAYEGLASLTKELMLSEQCSDAVTNLEKRWYRRIPQQHHNWTSTAKFDPSMARGFDEEDALGAASIE